MIVAVTCVVGHNQRLTMGAENGYPVLVQAPLPGVEFRAGFHDAQAITLNLFGKQPPAVKGAVIGSVAV